MPSDDPQIRLADVGLIGDGDFSASVDGVEFATGQNGISYDSPLASGFSLNLNSHSYGAQVEWDYVRFEFGENAVAVDEVSFGGVKALYR